MIETISRNEAVETIDRTNGLFFSVVFTKRGDGTDRKMNCRTKVGKGTNGRELRFDPRSKGLISVWDAKMNGYRFISIEGIKSIKANGRRFNVV